MGVRDFRLLWFARLVSLLGSWLLVVAVPAHVLQLTGSTAATGLTLAAEFLSPVLLGPVAGVLADRWDRRRLMIATDVLRAGAVAVLLPAREPGDVWLVYVALVAESVGTVLFRPAAQAHTPAVVGTGPALARANSLNAVTDGTVRLVGAPLGGALLGVAGFAALVWVDVATYLVSAVAIMMTSGTGAGERRSSRIRAGLREGVTFLRADKRVARLLAVMTVFLAANASLSALLVPFGVRVLGGSAQTGLVMSALGVGFLIGAPASRRLGERMQPSHLLACALVATGVAFVLLFVSKSLVGALPAAVLIGVFGSAALITAQTAVQRLTPNAVLGRLSAVQFTGEAVATCLGAVAGPALAQVASLELAACCAGGVTILSGLVAAPHPVVRSTKTTHDRGCRSNGGSRE